MTGKLLKLKVAEAIQDDVNKGIVRIDSSFMHELGIRPGDILEVKGERLCYVIVDRAYPGDIGLNIIRMDGITRRNSKTGISELVSVKKGLVKEAKRVTIAPAQKGIMIRASPTIFKQGLLGRPLSKGDIVSLGSSPRRRPTINQSPFFNDIFSMLDEGMQGFGFSDIKFIVVDTDPKQPVIVSDLTEVRFNPEAVESDEEKILDVTYEDIGGLTDEIKKVREMVELPLKHPEIFERLGIEPPKGVLLHGPPGTGKTLLAKAVANETNSHFVLINGPEIMSKFYGQSLVPEEKLLVEYNGEIQRIPIGKIVDEQLAVKVACFDEQGKICFRAVDGHIRHKTASAILEVKTKTGRSIRVTDDHSLFTVGDKGIEAIPTSSLVPGKSYIAVPKVLPSFSSTIHEINLLDKLKEQDYGIRIRNVQEYILLAKQKIGSVKTAELLGVNKKYLSDLITKPITVSASRFLHLMESANISIDTTLIQLCTKQGNFPTLLKLTPELLSFFGFWMAEGSYTHHRVRLSIHNREEKIIGELCERLFGHVACYRKPHTKGSDIFISSSILGKVMYHLLGFSPGARQKHVPGWIFSTDISLQAAFLRGYFSGDGSVHTKAPAPIIEVDTESPALADDISYMLLSFGIVANIYSRKNRPQKRICFAGYTNLEKFMDIGFFTSSSNEFIYRYIASKKFARRDQLPLQGCVAAFVKSNSAFSSWKDTQAIGKEVLLQYQLSESLQQLVSSDIYWDKVVSVTKVDAHYPYVYDVSVPGCHNFIAGFGGIFAHNSEQNIRKKFEEAEKNAPAIIFIDEIDAIAGKREDTHGEVEKRVVAQLLAIMDGMKARGKVVVIAATNIPDVLDGALRRPGRFDREIEIGVPGKEARLNILKIHSRNMPLTKNFDLKRIADITHGFVGADLASLSKEAAMVVLRRLLPELKLKEDEPIPKEFLEKLKISEEDFLEALKTVRPSAMREVLVEIPSIKWNDIGGLEQVKQELREAVEWPLKFPHAFTNLGVSPPKGILLYGPPGAGKTLLAKAVANESEANFILVKGPELLCVSADTKILTSHCGATAIEKFYENILPISEPVEKNVDYEVRKLLEPVFTFAIGENGETVKTQINTIHKLFVKDAYTIELKNNGMITGSANQPLFVYRNDALQWIPLSDIKEGDYVAYPRKLETLNRIVQISLPKYKHLRLVTEDATSYHVKIFSTKTITRLPKYLTKELASFLGWFVSEGNVSEEVVTICNYNQENQKEIVSLCEQFVDKSRISVYKGRVVVYSMSLVKYLEQLLEQQLGMKKSHTIHCPSILAKSTKEVIVSFLRAAYKGDGSISQTKIEYGSKSSALVEGISYLTTILGIKSKYWKRKDEMFMLTISGECEMQKFKNQIFDIKPKNDMRKEYNAQYKIPPVASLLKKIKQLSGLTYDKEIPDGSFEHVISGRRKLGLLRLQSIMQLFEKHVSDTIKADNNYKTLHMIAKGDFLWTTVAAKTKAKPQIMFDVETEHHSFIGGNIPLLLHNSKWVGESEKAVRKVFKRARQTSPTIIFFDEIDALAPRRGADGGNQVTERVVNQLLTEMDGLEVLTNVVVIAATNRPDMLDTALMRPGRFDRVILTSVPDFEARKSIFAVHTKNMPLTPDVDIDALAAKAEGYVGADIEAVCREAAIFMLRDDINAKKVTAHAFEKALEKVSPSVTKEIEDVYKNMESYFKQAHAKAIQKDRPVYYG